MNASTPRPGPPEAERSRPVAAMRDPKTCRTVDEDVDLQRVHRRITELSVMRRRVRHRRREDQRLRCGLLGLPLALLVLAPGELDLQVRVRAGGALFLSAGAGTAGVLVGLFSSRRPEDVRLPFQTTGRTWSLAMSRSTFCHAVHRRVRATRACSRSAGMPWVRASTRSVFLAPSCRRSSRRRRAARRPRVSRGSSAPPFRRVRWSGGPAGVPGRVRRRTARRCCAERRVDPVLGEQEHLAVGLPEPVLAHPLPLGQSSSAVASTVTSAPGR